MLRPSYTDLMKIVNEEAEGDTPVVNSRYTIVMATAKRARQIIADPDEMISHRAKPLSQAVKELSEGVLRIIPDDQNDADDIPPVVNMGMSAVFETMETEKGRRNRKKARDEDSENVPEDDDDLDDDISDDDEDDDDEDDDDEDEDDDDDDEDDDDEDPGYGDED